jgi:hypothetical protein
MGAVSHIFTILKGTTMKSKFSALLAIVAFSLILGSCKKSNPVSNETVYPVTAVVLNPAGSPQGGAILKLQGKADDDPTFAGVTDSTGSATIKAPAGQQTLVAKMGSIFETSFSVNVQASDAGTNAGSVKLQQNTSLKVLVVQASAEQLEDVLRDPIIGFTTFDSISVYALNDSVAADSNRALAFLQQYTLIFSDCDGGSEYSYIPLSRVYGRYINAGGKIYGGHYNYYHLQRIFSPYFAEYDDQSPTVDSVYIVNTKLSSYLGFTVAMWQSSDSRYLSGYEKFSDTPPTSKIYAVIEGTNPAIGVVVENYLGTGKYLWTDYHNQDVIQATNRDARLVKIVQYFLYSL